MVVLRPLPASLLLGFLLASGVASADPSPFDWLAPDPLPPTPAQTVSQANQDCGLATYRTGNNLIVSGDFLHAVEHYRAALRCWDHPAIHYNLAIALINLDQPIQVAEELDAALAGGRGPLSDDKFDHALEYRRLVEGQLGTVEVSCDRPGVRTFLDNKVVFTTPGTYGTRIRVGRHELLVERGTEEERIQIPFIGPGETYRIKVPVDRPPPPPPPPRTMWPYGVIGAGAVAAGAGLLFELSARSSYRQYDERVAACGSNMGCSSSGSDLLALRNTGDTKRSIAFATFGAAGALIVTGAVFAYLERPGSQPSSGDPEPSRPLTAFTPIVSPGMTGGMVQGQF
jgi:hypothetical protein